MKRVFRKLVCATLTASLLMSSVGGYKTEFIAPLTTNVYAAVAQVGIKEATGWLESAWVEWKPTDTANVARYQVSYSSNGTSYTTIDDPLIRKYNDGHWRADIVGLKAGTYTIKVTALNSSNTELGSETRTVTVTPHDRTGFAFSPKSRTYKDADPLQCGGYKGDGTVKDGAEILYIKSAEDINTVTDSYGRVGLSTILQGRDKKTTNPLIVRIIGKIDYTGGQLNGNGYIQIKPSKGYTDYQVTIEGIGEDATLNFGFLVKNSGNVEIRNLAVHDFADDGMSLDGDNTNIWLHNNEYFYGVQGSGDKAKGDGSADCKGDSQWVTMSYNHFWDAGKCSLCGMTSETGDNYISYHHNWFDHSDSRHPRIRTMFVHIYNNYYDGNAKYGVGTAKDSTAFVEGNYFRNCKHPMLSSKQGSDIMENENTGAADFSAKGTFSGENGGVIKAYNNYVEGADEDEFNGGSEPVYYDASATGTNGKATQFDAYFAKTRDEKVPETVTALVGGKKFNNDNVDSYILSLEPDEPAVARTKVEEYAGRTGGGDFAEATGFAFTDDDDKAYSINTNLRTALTNYYKNNSLKADRVIFSIGGATDGSQIDQGSGVIDDDESSSSTEATTETTTQGSATDPSTETTTSKAPESTGDGIHNFSVQGSSSTYYTISGSLSSSKGTVEYDGLTLTRCLKMESATSVTFNAAKAGSLTLVFGGTTDANGKKVKVDGVAYTVDATNIITIPVSAGVHTITKGDSINLFYMAMEEEGADVTEESTETTTSSSTTTTQKEPDSETTTKEPVATGNLYKASAAATAAGDVLFTGTDYSVVAGQPLNYTASNKTVDDVSFTGYIAASITVETTLNIDGKDDASSRQVITLKPTADGTMSIYFRLAPNINTGTKGAKVIQKVSDGKYTTVSGTDTTSTAEEIIKSVTFTVTANTEYIFVSSGTNPYVYGTSMTKSDGGTVEPTPTPTVLGDVNSDGAFDSNDVKALISYLVGKGTIDTEVADYNEDGSVTIKDAYAIAKAIKA